MVMDNAVSAMNSDGESQLVVFDLADEAYGVDIGCVREIIRMQEITKVPRTPKYVEGVINLRGKVIPVIDLRKRFGFPSAESNKDTRIVVIDIGGTDIGAVVDAVTEVLRLGPGSVEPPSAVIANSDSDYLLGIAKLETRVIILLDLQRALAVDAITAGIAERIADMDVDGKGDETPAAEAEEEPEQELQAAD